MAIVTSTIVEDAPQRDGRRYITERHVDHAGVAHFIHWMADAGVNVSAAMAARVATIEARLKERELERAIARAMEDGPAVQPVLNWSTNTEFGLALREYYKTAPRADLYRIGSFITQFGLTNNQLQTFFGLTAGQVTAARAKLTTFSDAYVAMLAAAGE